MKNISHLEDLALELPYPKLIEVMTCLILDVGKRKFIGNLSVKYDGTFMAYGNREGFFISDKGFLNKTPRMLRSVDDIIDAGFVPDKRDKFLIAFDALKNEKIYPDNVIIGDWLFDRRTLTDDMEFQANLLRYKAHRNLRPYQLGIAVHSAIFCGVHRFHAGGGRNPNVYFAPTRIFDDYTVQEFGKTTRLFELIGQLRPYEPLTGDTLKLQKKTLNTIVRSQPYYKQKDLVDFDEITQNNIDILVRFKYILLNYLGSVNSAYNKDFDVFIGEARAGHEGYVYRLDDITIKLVDRFVFSKQNFDKSVSRGWENELRGISQGS